MLTTTHQFRVNWLVLKVVIAGLELLVRHELDGAVRDTPQPRHEAFVEPSHALLTPNFVKRVHHALVVSLGRVRRRRWDLLVLQAQSRLHHPNRVGHGEREDAGLARGKHVHGGAQLRLGVALLHVSLQSVVAEITLFIMRVQFTIPNETYKRK
jgi:hypothetical protein